MKTKRTLLILGTLLFVLTTNAQQGINYKAIINDANGDALANSTITVQFTILENGTINVFQETHNPTTDANGIIIVNIGEGTLISGNFDAIIWGGNPHFLKTEIDTGGGLSSMGITEFKAVPYALHAETANMAIIDAVDDADAEPTNEIQNLDNVLIQGNSAGFKSITDLLDPNAPQDAATKSYVDALLEKIEYLESQIGLEETITDFDGNSYETVMIGNQIWMAENLKSTHYADGTPITLVTSASAWEWLGEKAYCYYDNDEYGNSDYGPLYNWAAVMNDYASSMANPSGIQGVCPDGWHVPSLFEWRELIDFLGGEPLAGGHLKEFGTSHWAIPNAGATNSSRFLALPGGWRNSIGIFTEIGYTAQYSSSSESMEGSWGTTYVHRISTDFAEIFPLTVPKRDGSSVRCVKD